MELNFSSTSYVLAIPLLLYWPLLIIYNLFFHPLARIRGPTWWCATRLGFIRSFVSGNLVRDVRSFHERYGDVVRTAPDEVSFAREDAWHDVLVGRTALPRNPIFFKAPAGQPDNLVVTTDAAKNARMRAVIMPAFTERALVKQEPVVQAYAGLLVNKLVERVIDFMSPMLEEKNDPMFERMSLPEIEATMSVLIIAGSETTATTLSGTLNCLVRSPDQLRTLEQEVRGAFQTEEQMTLRALQNLPFLNAVISEGLRVCNPLAGGILRIVPRGGATICGYFLPEGTHVAINPTAMSLSETNFHRAGEFLPQRFLPELMRPAEFSNDRRSNQKPFGLGSRNCLGKSFAMAEMRLVLARLVWRFDISAAPGKPLVDWDGLKTYVMVEKKPVNVVIKQRPGI